MHVLKSTTERYFKRRLVRGGPYVVGLVRIFRTQRPDEAERVTMVAFLDGTKTEPWGLLEGTEEIDADEYRYHRRLRQWATKQNWPPEARPSDPVDLTKLPL